MPNSPDFPDLPTALVDEYGDPEYRFGPNRKFRSRSMWVGSFLLLLGGAFLYVGDSALTKKAFDEDLCFLLMFLGGALMVLGGFALGARKNPRDWILICPRGLLRGRVVDNWNVDWNGIAWSEVLGFEDASKVQGLVAIEQGRIITADGDEWNFKANCIADYRRLADELKRRVKQGKFSIGQFTERD